MTNYTLLTYALYIPISVAITVWVARTLHRNGRVFLITAFHNNVVLADSVNHLLVVGFYLINIGYVTLALRYGDKPDSLTGAVEFLSTKVGLVLVVLGVMHLFNLAVFRALYAGRDHNAPANLTHDAVRRAVDRKHTGNGGDEAAPVTA